MRPEWNMDMRTLPVTGPIRRIGPRRKSAHVQAWVNGRLPQSERGVPMFWGFPSCIWSIAAHVRAYSNTMPNRARLLNFGQLLVGLGT